MQYVFVMTHSRCIKHGEHSLGKTAMLSREQPAGSDIDNRLAPAFVSVMQKTKINIYLALVWK